MPTKNLQNIDFSFSKQRCGLENPKSYTSHTKNNIVQKISSNLDLGHQCDFYAGSL